ncbi:MAG: gliding motility protein GldM [Chitinophagaceae bacterium]|nr:MAG: gliding motility protein GldM [Chitinophagaceae bacterium]
MSLSLPKPPRQKMINLLYIVLTAMLALNVSAEILNAFKTVNKSIHQSNESIDQKNTLIYEQFAKQMQQDPAKVGPLKAQAEQVKAQCDAMNTYIDSLKNVIIVQSGGRDDSGNIKKMDDLDAAPRVMENQKNGPKLKARLEELRASLLGFYPPDQRVFEAKSFPLTLETPSNAGKKSWTVSTFDMVPTIAAVTILSKFQNDVKNAEAQIIDYLYGKINAQQFTLDTYKPLVSANSGYIMQGQQYQAQIMLGAYSATVNPSITVDGQSVPVQNGIGTYTTTGAGIGEHTYNVVVSLKDKNGVMKPFTATGSYMVGAPSLSVSATKMNVLFIGVENPISIAESGVPSENLSASISQGSLTKAGNGEYVARVTTVGNANVNVSGTVGGKAMNFGAMKFRVMRVPDPVAEVGGNKGGRMQSAVFRVQEGVQAVLENFYFDLKFPITHFTIAFEGTGFDNYIQESSNSAYFTPAIKQLMQRCRPGTRVFVDDIRAKAPDGTIRSLPSIFFNLY